MWFNALYCALIIPKRFPSSQTNAAVVRCLSKVGFSSARCLYYFGTNKHFRFRTLFFLCFAQWNLSAVFNKFISMQIAIIIGKSIASIYNFCFSLQFKQFSAQYFEVNKTYAIQLAPLCLMTAISCDYVNFGEFSCAQFQVRSKTKGNIRACTASLTNNSFTVFLHDQWDIEQIETPMNPLFWRLLAAFMWKYLLRTQIRLHWNTHFSHCHSVLSDRNLISSYCVFNSMFRHIFAVHHTSITIIIVTWRKLRCNLFI